MIMVLKKGGKKSFQKTQIWKDFSKQIPKQNIYLVGKYSIKIL